VINAVLILMVIRQIREHPLDLRSPAAPVLAVGAAVLFLHSAAFAVAASKGAGPAIARFSIAHHITGSAAWGGGARHDGAG
jgi:hypothetical protein